MDHRYLKRSIVRASLPSAPESRRSGSREGRRVSRVIHAELANSNAFTSVGDYMLVQRSRSKRFLLWTFIVAAHGGCGSRPSTVSRVPDQDVPQVRASPSDWAESGGVPPAVGEVCDTDDRIVVVDARPVGPPVIAAHGSTTDLAGSVVVISRSEGRRVTAAIDRGSVLYDDCGGSAGSHAGCSDLGGSTIRSAALGLDELFLDPYGHRSVLVHDGIASPCRDKTAGLIATCSTRSWFAVVDRAEAVSPSSGSIEAAELRPFRTTVLSWQSQQSRSRVDTPHAAPAW
ncbi:MAG TPA: hypothetical protein VM513_21995 [Kofleriaceae bacterium]|nr:hypothetical protein [Kofleriaceae bacterium]